MNSPYKVKHIYPSGPVPIEYDAWGNAIKYIDPRDMIENQESEKSGSLFFFLFFFIIFTET